MDPILYNRVMAVLTKKFGLSASALGPEVQFGELELDSLTRTEFIIVLEQELSVRFQEAETTLYTTLAELVNMLQAKGARV
ncbi:acyl carrier protein [Sorangium sp. So ce269]